MTSSSEIERIDEPRVRASEDRRIEQLISKGSSRRGKRRKKGRWDDEHCRMVVSMLDESCRTARGAAMAVAAKPRARAAEAASIVEEVERVGRWGG